MKGGDIMQHVKTLKDEERKRLLGKISSKKNEVTIAPKCPGPCPLNPCRITYKQYKSKIK